VRAAAGVPQGGRLSRERWSEVALVATCAVWGLTFAMVQDAVAELPVPAFLAYRFLAAAALVGLVFRHGLARLGADGVRAGALMGVFLAAGYLFQTYALQHTTASNAGFLTGLFTPLTPLLAALVLRTPPTRMALGAAALATVGVALLSGVGGEGLHPLGDALSVGCATCFAAHILATDRGVKGRDVGALLTVQLAVVGAICLVIAAAQHQLEAPAGAAVWSALIVTTVFASAGGFFAQTYAQQYAPPARVALILAMEPAFAGLFGWLLAGDTLGAAGFAGAALILVAIVAVDLVPRLRPPRPLPEG
jgi:drug/metabolite transporter (DMT)-like permease